MVSPSLQRVHDLWPVLIQRHASRMDQRVVKRLTMEDNINSEVVEEWLNHLPQTLSLLVVSLV